MPNGLAMWPKSDGPWGEEHAEAFARDFLEIAGYEDAHSAKVEAIGGVAFNSVATPLKEVTFTKHRKVWLNMRGYVTNFWDERPQAKGAFYFKSENEARNRIGEIAKRLGLLKEQQREFAYNPPGKHPNGYVGVGAHYAVPVNGLPVFGGGEVDIQLDPVTGSMKYYAADRDFIVEKSEHRISRGRAAALARTETDKKYGGEAEISEEPELGYVVLPGQKVPPYRIRLAWEVGLRNTLPYSVVVDAQSGKAIGWKDSALRMP
ncbi:MAG: hypothetical protein M3R13_07675 [Armatimonadota bacterium]|nr:hypothetical protein [Armatimonadota bacterium]